MKAFNSLETPRMKIRRLTSGDKERLSQLLCDTSVTMNMAFPDDMLTVDGVSRLLVMTINSYDSEKPLLSFAITDKTGNDLIGVTGLSPQENNEVEVFYALLPGYWGRGLASEVLECLTEYVFTKTSYTDIVAPITINNLASIRVAEKNGFLNCGLKKDPRYKEQIVVFKRSKNRAD